MYFLKAKKYNDSRILETRSFRQGGVPGGQGADEGRDGRLGAGWAALVDGWGALALGVG
ncbi:MAG: hypothetical protein ACOYI4_00900 [Christensenellales bacterium]|jgi:hypothetical protein